MSSDGSRVWRSTFRILFRTVPHERMRKMRLNDPSVPIEELVVRGRNSGLERRLLVSFLRVGDAWYVGHPNGQEANWVRNLQRAGTATVVFRDGKEVSVVPVLLEDGPERDRAIEAAGAMPRPAGPIYRMGRAHIRAVGAYFRLDPADGPKGEGQSPS